MTGIVISDNMKEALKSYLAPPRKSDLLQTYMFFIEKNYHVCPVAFPVGKTIYQSEKEALSLLEAEGRVWRETEIKVRFEQASVNEETKRIYICPFSGKVFADNTHPNPQDAIYDWVSKCPENTERVDGLRVKRFFVSEDPEVIENYIEERKEPITKIAFSSAVSNKLFGSKEAVIDDFKKNYLRPLTLLQVQNQNRFEIEEHFLHFLQEHLQEERVTSFVEALAQYPEFGTAVERWVLAAESEGEEAEEEVEEEATLNADTEE